VPRALTALLLLGACIGPLPARPADAISVGLVLPFTGSSGSIGQNEQLGVLMVVDEVNDAGGIAGHPLELVIADTRSDDTIAVQAATDVLSQNVIALIAPENYTAAASVYALARAKQVTLISPVVGSGAPADVDESQPWFRLAPSPSDMGSQLANVLVAAGYQRVVVAAGGDGYDQAFASSLSTDFVAKSVKGAVVSIALPDATNYETEARSLLEARADATVLLAPPLLAARFVTAAASVTGNALPAWYLSPRLRSDIFIRNTISTALEGATGVTPAIFVQRETFAAAFKDKWPANQPLDDTYSCYDAAAMLALALQVASAQPGGLSSVNLNTALAGFSRAHGAIIHWDQLAEGLGEAASGNVYYSGLIGPLDFDKLGNRFSGRIQLWTIQSGAIVDPSGF
jgi:neutral amino acid transport system substrate-binding protein